MNRQRARALALALTLIGPVTARGDSPQKAADDHFESLLAAARKEPDKADWKALRTAFAATSHFQPYNIDYRKDFDLADKKLEAGDAAGAEGVLLKRLERDRYMRLDTHLRLGAMYSKAGRKDKEKPHGDFIKGILGTLIKPGTGHSAEKSIEVLYIDEEYFFLSFLNIKAKRDGLVVENGRRFDVYTTGADSDPPFQKYYFNVDLAQRSLEKLEEPAGKGADRARQ